MGLWNENLQVNMCHVQENGNCCTDVQRRNTFSKIISSDDNRDSHFRKIKGGEVDPPTNTEKGRANKCKKKLLSLRERRRLVRLTHACCIDLDTPLRILNYSRNTPLSMPHSGHTKTNNPAPEATKGVVIPPSYMAICKRWTPWYPMMQLPQGKRMG